MAHTFKRFGKKQDRIKDVASTMVCEMHEQDQLCREEMKGEMKDGSGMTKNVVGLTESINRAF